MALWLAIVGLPFAAGIFIGRTTPTGNDVTSGLLALLVVLAPYAIVGSIVAERVSLSRRDIFLSRTTWIRRAAFLPYRDWPPLPSEVDRLERIEVEGDKRRIFRLR
ncbi:hypothetical protein [Acrocarpospora sp. B8E8]|uniref:hypothetical protein n=1 Tax=Acrocarpospora sp. B8E8 TaxID=3153572 RepID=UPI00325E089D